MSKMGFHRVIARIEITKRIALEEMMKAAQKEFKSNFDMEEDASKGSWKPVKRATPPPILIETERLKNETLNPNNIVYSNGNSKAVLTVDPIDDRGRGYAAYHQDGIGVAKRSFLSQSRALTDAQRMIILKTFEYAFGSGSVRGLRKL